MSPKLMDLLEHALFEKEPLIIVSLKNYEFARSLSDKRVIFITEDCPEGELIYTNLRGEIRCIHLNDGSVWEAQRDEHDIPLGTKRRLRSRSLLFIQ